MPGGEILLRYREVTGADINWILTGFKEQPAQGFPPDPDERLGLYLAASISAAYESFGKTLPAGILGKMIVSYYHKAMLISDQEARESYVAGVAVHILRDLEKSTESEASSKRSA